MSESLDLPLAFTRLWVGLLGLTVGSFLNVVIHRLPRGESIVHPRSRCPGCGHAIRWFENIPVLSWLALRGRCARCKSRIAWRYPAVELLTGAVFVAAHESLGFTPALALALPFAAALLALVFIDAAHLLLPDAITLPFTLAGLALSFVSPLTTPSDALLGVLLSWFVLEGMNLAYKLVRGRDGFGGGDTKMMLMVSAFLGWQMALFTMVVGSFLGVLVGIPVLALASRRGEDAGKDVAEEPPASDAAPVAAATEPAPVARATEPAPVATATEPAPVAGATEPAPVARATETLPEDATEPAPTWRDVVPRDLDEALPLLLVPACAASWLLEGGSPDRALAGLLAGIVLAMGAHRLLRRSGRQSPASRLLPLAGALAGLPLKALPLGAGLLAVAVAALIFRPPLVAARPEPADEPQAEADAAAPASFHLQSELPFGVFLGAAALVALLWGEPILDWYVVASARLLGVSEP